MNLLNGIEEEKNEIPIKSELWGMLPDKVDAKLLSEIDNRIEQMNVHYNPFIRRNRLLSAIAILETEVNEIENEINRL
ncbi:hypothetical protein QP519_10950 [Weeksella virosa]|uniref:hypothetical protein n=1 Tax=Weeksella virosa TaxID=1014 RepID=UPI002554BE6F|nr:hypothetical protein [Weeksella virosa]MDK7376049.1 hypothetical protein [Weeksella virosa]